MSDRDNEKVIVWRNASDRHRMRDTGGGKVMFKPEASMVMNERERSVRGAPPSGVNEEVMTRKDAERKYGKTPSHDE
ncbi:MAG: hypothetical protein DRP45_04840 [Candidatus Zixiibacteriota bacterium]|nr:MAG: hypothetical protein DRP45_04840 [candidate division Zixibacteria bacterium]